MKLNYKIFLAHQTYNKHLFPSNICSCGAEASCFKLKDVLPPGTDIIECCFWK